MSRRASRVVILFVAAALASPCTRCSVAERITESVTSEYANLPVSNTELRANIRHADLILHGKIVAYKPPTFGDHVATMEVTTVLIETTYSGTNKPGETLTYECVCHQVEQPPSSAERIGHQVILFLVYDRQTHKWSPATSQAELYFHPELASRLKKLLAGKP